MKRLMVGVLCLSMVGLIASVAFAQFAKPEDAIKYRQSAMSLIGTHMTRMGAVVKGEVPYNKAAFEKNASVLLKLIKLPGEAFMTPGSAAGSKLKPEALTEKDNFMKLAKASSAEAQKLMNVAKEGDLNTIKTQFGATGATCKACHDAYRVK